MGITGADFCHDIIGATGLSGWWVLLLFWLGLFFACELLSELFFGNGHHRSNLSIYFWGFVNFCHEITGAICLSVWSVLLLFWLGLFFACEFLSENCNGHRRSNLSIYFEGCVLLSWHCMSQLAIHINKLSIHCSVKSNDKRLRLWNLLPHFMQWFDLFPVWRMVWFWTVSNQNLTGFCCCCLFVCFLLFF